jgi:hypothetical protein
LAQPDCVDHTVRKYQPDEMNQPVTETYINSWILKPTELVANDWSIGITSGSQTTFVKVKYRSTGQIFVQARTSHATPSSHRYTWTDPQESPVTLDKSDESTDGKPVAKPMAIINNNQCQQQEESGSETTVEEITAWTVPSETPSKKFKKHRDDKDPDSSAGLGPVDSSAAHTSSPR